MSARASSLFLLLSLVFAASFAGCKSDPEKPPLDGGSVDGTDDGADDGGDDGEEDDGLCRSHDKCAANEYCELSTGLCLPAKACASNQHCAWQDGHDDYCAFGACFCDLERNGGTCLPRFRLCSSCERDVQCGDDWSVHEDYQAKCATFEGTKVCLPLKGSGCPPGYVPTADATCVPGGGACDGSGACSSDDDCDPSGEKPVCDTTRGICIPACRFDYSSGKSDCPPEQVCHVDPRLLNPGNLNFGYGRCGATCQDGGYECAPGLSCEPDGDPHTADTLPNRCRPEPPSCVRDADCPASLVSNSRGYCDRQTLECGTGCRIDDNCSEGYRCVAGSCEQKTCIERGGANLACDLDQFCCGEPGSVTPCPTGVSVGQCYDAPDPPWCGEGCSSAQTPGGGRPQPSQCIQVKGHKEKGDVKIQAHACDPANKGADCPRSWGCKPFIQFCETNADCGAGGECGEVNAGDYGKFKGCLCSGGKSCPSTSTCAKDDDGNDTYCEANWCEVLSTCLKLPPETQSP